MNTLVLHILIALLSTAVLWAGSSLLESASERLAVHYRLPDVVTGAVVVAVGSSFPELSTTVISTVVHGEFELGVSAIVGSAIFNILVIPGLSGLFGGPKLQANRDLVYKEAQFYMLSVAVLLVTFSFAVIYRPVASTGGAISGELNRVMAIIPVFMYALYVFVQWQDTVELDIEASDREIRPGREWLRLGVSLLLIVAGVEGLVRAALVFGESFGTPSYLWGVTVIAAATSLPDALMSIRAARRGKSVTSLANVLGSNVFDLLVAVPVGVLIAGATVINFSIAAPMMGVLTLATLLLFVLMRTRMGIATWESWLLLGAYGLFLVWISLESVGVIDTIPSLPPQTRTR